MNKKILAVAIAGAVAVPMAAQAIEYKISGHVNRMIRYADNGDGSDIQNVDNGASQTRFRIQGSEDIGNGLKAGVYIESAVSSNSSSAVTLKSSPGDQPAAFDTAFNIRHSALFFSGNWGKVTMGHTSDAQDGTSFADLSNTWLVNEWSSAELVGAVTYGGVGGGGTAVSSAQYSFDGGRRDVVRYDSPALGPVTVAASIANNSRYSVGAFASTSLGGGELSAAAGYTSFGGDAGTSRGLKSQWSGSLSYLFSQGTSITGGYGGGDLDSSPGRSDPDSYYVKLGHQWGSHAVSAHYGAFNDLTGSVNPTTGNFSGEDNSMWGLGWVYTMRKDIEIYAGYNNYSLDRSGSDDIDAVVAGTRVKF